MATTAAHAGNSISFEIEGHKIRIEAPKNCDSLSCIQVSAPSLSGSGFGFKNIKSSHDDDVAQRTDPPAPAAPVAEAGVPPPAVPDPSKPPAPPVARATPAPPPPGP